jgi:energy-coupling factor transport system permease protein
MAPIPLVGPIGFSPEGCVRGLFYALRILLIVWASFVVTFTTASHELTGSFSSFLSPLRALRAPVDDIAMVLSLALRFIPLVAAEFASIRAAQVSRGAAYGTGSPWKRISGYSTVMVPLFVGMFRRADRMADAMDARCYGAGERTQLNPRSFTAASAAVLLAGTLLCIALALAF